MKTTTEQIVSSVKFNANGLVPVVVQNKESREVCLLAYANSDALALTIESGEAWFWSRSRQTLWHKGATSGNRLLVRSIMADCDNDALIYMVEPLGCGICHTTGPDGKNRTSCFFRQL